MPSSGGEALDDRVLQAEEEPLDGLDVHRLSATEITEGALCPPWPNGLLVAHERVVTAHVGALHLRRVAVDERAAVHRMREAAHLVLELEELLPVLRIDDVLEAILVRVAFLRDELVLQQELVGSGEIRDVDRDMVAVVRAGWRRRSRGRSSSGCAPRERWRLPPSTFALTPNPCL